MKSDQTKQKMIMRLFHVRAKPGQAPQLLEKFARTSVKVVQQEPGNQGYFFGQGVEDDDDIIVFASFWTDLAAIKRRFGETWQSSFLPEGYEELIAECWVEHIDLGAGWFVRPGQIVSKTI